MKRIPSRLELQARKSWEEITQPGQPNADSFLNMAPGASFHKQRKARKAQKAAKKPAKPAIDAFYSSKDWKTVRYRALRRANGHCECCGAGPEHGAVLNVDHIKPRKRYPHLALDLANLQVLCVSCNLGKGNWDQTDWRKPSPEIALDAQHLADLRERGLLN